VYPAKAISDTLLCCHACHSRCPGSTQLVDVLGDLEVWRGVGIDVEDGPVACADARRACPQLGVSQARVATPMGVVATVVLLSAAGKVRSANRKNGAFEVAAAGCCSA
jgi:hypothetical protein